MKVSRKAVLIWIGLAAIALLSPIWGFELVYHYGVWGEVLPKQAAGPAVPPLMREALWVASGETAGAGIEMLWVGNFFRGRTALSQPARGRAALRLVSRRIVDRDPARRLRRLERHVRLGAVAVWLSRHACESDLKQHLAHAAYFGRAAWGTNEAATAFFGQPVDQLIIGQVAILAALPDAPSRLDPTCHPEQAEKRRAYVLGRLRASGAISPAEFEEATNEKIAVLPVATPCRETPFSP